MKLSKKHTRDTWVRPKTQGEGKTKEKFEEPKNRRDEVNISAGADPANVWDPGTARNAAAETETKEKQAPGSCWTNPKRRCSDWDLNEDVSKEKDEDKMKENQEC